MLRVNLHPERERARRAPAEEEEGGFSLPRPEIGIPEWVREFEFQRDPWTTGLVVAGVLSVTAVAGMWLLQRQRAADLSRRIEAARSDSTRLASLMSLTDSLRAEREELRLRLSAIRRVDRTRYAWPHLLDELSRALPDGVWLTGLEREAPLPDLTVSVRGMASDPLAVTSYVRSLEGQPHVGQVEIQGSQREAGGRLDLHRFTLRARYASPPQEAVRTEPLLTAGGLSGGGG